MKKWLPVLLLSCIMLLLAACGDDDNAATKDDGKLHVYTTVYPLQYFAEQIGGEHVNVQSIYPAGANEHTFEPTMKDMLALADADFFFYIGQGLEGFVEKAKETLKDDSVKLVATADAVTEEQLHISTGHTHAEAITEEAHDHDHDEEGHEHDEDGHDHSEDGHDHAHTDHDPHVWLSPVISKELALAIKNEFVSAMPEQEATFTANYEAIIAELDTLHAEFEAMAAATTAKTFFVSHAAFGYIAGHYGLKQVPVAGLNSQSEPSQKELVAITKLAKEENIEYIFFEQNVSSKLATIIQDEIGAESLILHNLSVLTQEDIDNNETYFTLMRKNIENLQKALQ